MRAGGRSRGLARRGKGHRRACPAWSRGQLATGNAPKSILAPHGADAGGVGTVRGENMARSPRLQAGQARAVKKLGLTPCFDSTVLFPPLAANPEVACYGMIPSPTRHVPAPIHPRLFAGGDSHRSQGFLYPWKPYAPPHIPVYCRFVPPPQAAEQTGKPVGTPAMFLPPAAAKTSRECVGECGAAMGPGVKKPQATVLIAYGENAPGAVPEHAKGGQTPHFSCLRQLRTPTCGSKSPFSDSPLISVRLSAPAAAVRAR